MKVTQTVETHSCVKIEIAEEKMPQIIIISSVQEENPRLALRKGF